MFWWRALSTKQLFAYGQQVTEQIYINDPVDHVPLAVQAVDIPVTRESDPFVFHFTFACYSSCLNSVGDAKNQLKVRFYILTSQNEVLARREQQIRITANPGRDARDYTRKKTSLLVPLATKIRKEVESRTTKRVKYTIEENGEFYE